MHAHHVKKLIWPRLRPPAGQSNYVIKYKLNARSRRSIPSEEITFAPFSSPCHLSRWSSCPTVTGAGRLRASSAAAEWATSASSAPPLTPFLPVSPTPFKASPPRCRPACPAGRIVHDQPLKILPPGAVPAPAAAGYQQLLRPRDCLGPPVPIGKQLAPVPTQGTARTPRFAHPGWLLGPTGSRTRPRRPGGSRSDAAALGGASVRGAGGGSSGGAA